MPPENQNPIIKLLSAIDGYKTYIVAIGAICTAIGSYLNHSIDLTQLVSALFAATSTMTIRHGISKAENSK